ncbi:MAG: RsmE family RNA methyltransferase, partial [Woeseiaceae bacterium]
LDEKRADKRREHWQRVAQSACEQSGRTRPPVVDAPITLNSWFGATDAANSTGLILDPRSQTPLASVELPETKLRLLVGPEGGFSDREHEDARIAGFTPVSLGPRILRTETATVASIVAAQLAWGDMGC